VKSELSGQRARYLADDFSRGFIHFCGIKADRVERGLFQSRLKVEDQHRQQDGFIHAGVMATMADHTAGYSGFTVVEEDLQILTIEFKINFLRPAFGEGLVCRSRAIREGRVVIVSESEVFDVRGEEEIPVARALTTLMAVSAQKLKSKS